MHSFVGSHVHVLDNVLNRLVVWAFRKNDFTPVIVHGHMQCSCAYTISMKTTLFNAETVQKSCPPLSLQDIFASSRILTVTNEIKAHCI